MKKKYLLACLVLGASSFLCGFDSTMTADSVLYKCLHEYKDTDAFTFTMKFPINVSVNIGELNYGSFS